MVCPRTGDSLGVAKNTLWSISCAMRQIKEMNECYLLRRL